MTNMPTVNFSTFVISMHSSGLFHLGLLNDPITNKKEKNLDLAKQTIDLLAMLEEKTKGNLSSEEDNLLKNTLSDLRVLFVKEKK